jgi:hypothetical protein
MTAQVAAYPAAEKLVVEILSAAYAGITPAYVISPVVPDTLPLVTITVEDMTGAPLNIFVDKPVLVLSTITSRHTSGDAGYGISDELCHDLWRQLFNARAIRWNNGVVSAVKVVADPHRVPDTNVDIFRFQTTIQLTVHA